MNTKTHGGDWLNLDSWHTEIWWTVLCFGNSLYHQPVWHHLQWFSCKRYQKLRGHLFVMKVSGKWVFFWAFDMFVSWVFHFLCTVCLHWKLRGEISFHLSFLMGQISSFSALKTEEIWYCGASLLSLSSLSNIQTDPKRMCFQSRLTSQSGLINNWLGI